MSHVNFYRCPYCDYPITDLKGLIDYWEEKDCRYCGKSFSVRTQTSKESHIKLNEDILSTNSVRK